MSLVRSDLAETLIRWREAGFALAVLLAGVWLFGRGGWLFQGLGLLVAAAAAGWMVIAVRRIRFSQRVAAPGVIEVDEGQVGYLGPSFGGFVSLRELTELQLVEFYGRRHWRLKQADGQVLVIPIAASGSEALFDAFASLPGIDMQALLATLHRGAAPATVWRRDAPVALT